MEVAIRALIFKSLIDLNQVSESKPDETLLLMPEHKLILGEQKKW